MTRLELLLPFDYDVLAYAKRTDGVEFAIVVNQRDPASLAVYRLEQRQDGKYSCYHGCYCFTRATADANFLERAFPAWNHTHS